jgi:hypothetical protein
MGYLPFPLTEVRDLMQPFVVSIGVGMDLLAQWVGIPKK